jgi:hypothetical protein
MQRAAKDRAVLAVGPRFFRKKTFFSLKEKNLFFTFLSSSKKNGDGGRGDA